MTKHSTDGLDTSCLEPEAQSTIAKTKECLCRMYFKVINTWITDLWIMH
jgi:hypothetical protein